MASITARAKRFRAEVCVSGKRTSKTFPTMTAAQAWAQRMERSLSVRQEFEGGALAGLVPRRVLQAIADAEYQQSDVIAGQVPASTSCGVYFLLRHSEIVYVGQSVDVFLRLSKHRREGRDFDAFNFLPCAKEDLDRIEKMYIEAFMPKWNLRI